MYYLKNLETDKVEVHFSKAEYQAMPADRKAVMKSRCRWSPSVQAWTSRTKLDHSWQILFSLKEWNFEDRGSTGEKLSFAEKVEREQEKATDRADRMDTRHDKAVKESEATFNRAHTMLSCIPPGQPILVGHHSERGHRNLLKKHDNAMRKGFELDEKADYYRNRYNNAIHTAEGSKYKNAGYLVNRIKECETNIRTYERRLLGKIYHYSTPREISQTEREGWTEMILEEKDKLNYMQYCLEKIAEVKGLFTKENLAGKKFILIGSHWHEIVRLNPKSISVYNTCFPQREAQKKWPLKYNYGQVKEAK